MRAIRTFDLGATLARVASSSARRAALVVGAAMLLAIAGAALALRLDPGRTASAAGDGGEESAAATKELRSTFGADPVVVLVRGRLTGMLLTEDVARMLSLEGCISGNVPRGAEPAAPVCSEFARAKPVQVVYGPGTFINEAANQVLDRINFDRAGEAAAAARAEREARRVARRRGLSEAEQEEFAQEARRIVTARYAQRALELAVRFGLNSVPALNNPEFVLQLVFEPSLGAEFPKPRFAYLFPHSDAAVIQARLRPGLSDGERQRAVEMVREAVGAKPFELKFGSYVVSGSPVVAEGVAAGLSDAAPALIAATLLLVALALVLAFRRRPVLLPLALGAGAAAVTLGGVSLVGGSFSVGVAAALPVLCALAAGWALPLQAGFGAQPGEGPEALERTARSAGPTVALAALGAAGAFATLLLSPIAMARSFGGLVAIGVMVSLALSLTAGAAVAGGRAELARRLAPTARVPARAARAAAPAGRRLREALARGGRRLPHPRRVSLRRAGGRRRSRKAARPGPRTRPARPHRRRAAVARALAAIPRAPAAGVRAAIGALGHAPALLVAAAKGAAQQARRRPGRVLKIAVAVAAVGFVAATQIDVTADQRRLLPADRVEALDLASIVRETGTPGDVNLIVRSERLLDPVVVRWMTSYQRRVLRQNGFRPERPCRQADLCPALSLTNLFGAGRQSAGAIREAVDALPRYFSQNVISADRRTANIAFRMGATSPSKRREVVDGLRAELNPPPGVDADLAGPVVAAADGEGEVMAAMWLVALAALLVVAAASAAAGRSLAAALVVAIPLGLAVGWTFLVLFLLPLDVDFLTALLGAIVVAVAAGPVLLSTRDYRAARAAGVAPEDAARRMRTPAGGQAVSFGAVAVAGFLALTVVEIPALRDLGAAGAVALPLCGLGLAVSLPATLVWADRRGGLRVPRTRSEVAGAGRSLAAPVRAAARGGRRAASAVRRGVPRAGRKVRAVVTSRR